MTSDAPGIYGEGPDPCLGIRALTAKGGHHLQFCRAALRGTNTITRYHYHPHHPADVPATLPLLSPCLLVHLHRVRRHCLLHYWRRCTNLKESVLRYRLMDSHPTITPASAFSIPGKTHIVHLVEILKPQCSVVLIAYGYSERNSTYLGWGCAFPGCMAAYPNLFPTVRERRDAPNSRCLENPV